MQQCFYLIFHLFVSAAEERDGKSNSLEIGGAFFEYLLLVLTGVAEAFLRAGGLYVPTGLGAGSSLTTSGAAGSTKKFENI